MSQGVRQLVYCLNEIVGFSDMLLNESLGEDHQNKVRVKMAEYVTKNNNKYKVIRYDKEMLAPDIISSTGLLRSVIINNKNRVVSFAPPKSISYESFVNKNPDKIDSVFAEEFVEGTMINVFWDETSGLSGSWEIATRNTVGAEVCFFKSNEKMPTFRDMFLEAAKKNNLELNMLNPMYCYSFVLQHPENRIVVPFNSAQLYLVEVYEIVQTEGGVVNVFPLDLNIVKSLGYWNTTRLKFPQVYEFTKYDNLKEKYASMNTSYEVLGVVIKNKVTGERCKIRNPVYEYVRHLRGNQPKKQYQYLELRKEGKVGDFLNFYPENKKDFSYFRDKLHDFTNALYQNYISCYIKKERPLKEFPDHFRTHMFHIHKQYTDILKPKNDYVNNTVVINYVNGLHPSLQMYSMNACLRKRTVDFAKVDSTTD
uniref:T4 RNA ligase 1-like N-terminal domain-containing protein n=1 Tax=viral metagenome TaxID=1070528 RepID=A0A6C0JZC3_9ZZZZ